MGLTSAATGRKAIDKVVTGGGGITVALAGNPNVGKSTLFNAITGLRQHTGNWAGKTVAVAQGVCRRKGVEMNVIDLPGCYSLHPRSREECVAGDYIKEGCADVCIVVCDASCPERGVRLALQVSEIIKKVILCINLTDEAEKKGIVTDGELISKRLGVPVVFTSGTQKQGIGLLLDTVLSVYKGKEQSPAPIVRGYAVTDNEREGEIADIVKTAQNICSGAVSRNSRGDKRDRMFDRLFTGKYTAFPIMLLLVALVFWLTIQAANYPSQWLSDLFHIIGDGLRRLFHKLNSPQWLEGALLDGVYKTLAWVVSVMLPPMALFFPLFALLEDSGYLPRVAFNMDRCMKGCGACGKQSLTMLMGFGCNAAGVTGCRIMDSPRQRLMATVTNSLVPCNGRFPTLIALITVFFSGEGQLASLVCALFLTGLVICSLLATLGASKLLSVSVLKGLPTSFVLEMPSYRRPKVLSVVLHSLTDRTLAVLGRAVAAAAPAGLIIWLLANVSAGGQPLLKCLCDFLDAPARLFGMDGKIVTGYIVGIPANEIAMPAMLMAYTSGSSLTDQAGTQALKSILTENGWTNTTALCTLFFCLFHWPCATTLLTVKKETGSIKWTLLSFALPTVIGLSICFLIKLILG